MCASWVGVLVLASSLQDDSIVDNDQSVIFISGKQNTRSTWTSVYWIAYYGLNTTTADLTFRLFSSSNYTGVYGYSRLVCRLVSPYLLSRLASLSPLYTIRQVHPHARTSRHATREPRARDVCTRRPTASTRDTHACITRDRSRLRTPVHASRAAAARCQRVRTTDNTS